MLSNNESRKQRAQTYMYCKLRDHCDHEQSTVFHEFKLCTMYVCAALFLLH